MTLSAIARLRKLYDPESSGACTVDGAELAALLECAEAMEALAAASAPVVVCFIPGCPDPRCRARAALERLEEVVGHE